MAEGRTITEEEIANSKLLTLANRQINLTYIMAACLDQSFQDMDGYLKQTGQQLTYNNKRYLNELVRSSKRTQFLIKELQKVSCLTLDEDALYEHDDAGYKIYSILMEIISVCGVDDGTEIRLWTLYNMIREFKHLITFPKAELRAQIAWSFTEKKINMGDFGKVEVKSTKIPTGILEKIDYISQTQGLDVMINRNPKTHKYHATICGTEFKSDLTDTIKDSFKDLIAKVEAKTDWLKFEE